MAQGAGTEGITVFAMPVQVNDPGFVYAKVLATEGNAVNDGYHANGSVEGRTGWRVSFAWIYANGTRVELGEFVDGTPTQLVPVAPESDQLVMTVRWPADAQTVGGADQTAWTALAFRQQASSDPGSTSGVSMDQAKAIALALHFDAGIATAPAGTGATIPATPQAPTPTPATPTPASGNTKPPTPGASPSPSASPRPSPRPSPSPAEQSPTPAVGPIESTAPANQVQLVYVAPPTWFYATLAVVAVVAVASLLLVAVGLVLLARARRRAPLMRRVVRVPVRVHAQSERTVEEPRQEE
jgi:hypothetical protein